MKKKGLVINNIYDKGSLTVDDTYVEKAKTDAANTVWTLPATPTTTAWTIYNGAGQTPATSYSLNSDFESTAQGFENYYVMPQAVSGQTLTVTYDVVTTFTSGSVATRPYERTINLSNISAVTNWYTNKYITYTINISPADLVPITFSAKEEKWCEEVNGSQDVK